MRSMAEMYRRPAMAMLGQRSLKFRASPTHRPMPRTLAPISLLLTLACSDPVEPQGPPAPITALPRTLSASEQAITASTPAFGLALLQRVNPSFANDNVFLSPLSASMALGMTMNGTAGTTFDEMRTALALPNQPLAELNAGYRSLITLLRGLDPAVDFRLANSIWYTTLFASAVNPSFLQDTRTYFDARVTALDFRSPAALTTINAWVDSSTNGKIPRILDQIPAEMVMYLINAIYFRGDWRLAFDPKRTTEQPFTTATGSQVPARMMTRAGGFRAAMVDGATVVEVPYGGDAYVMTVVMPAAGQSIDAFVAGLTPAAWSRATSAAVQVGEREELTLPKFTLSWESRLNEPLQAMGMRQAFVAGGADFTRLSPSAGRDLFISEVKQKTWVEVNETGTTAAAVTSVGVGVTSMPPMWVINRPFVVAIRERLSGTLLFLGKVVRP